MEKNNRFYILDEDNLAQILRAYEDECATAEPPLWTEEAMRIIDLYEETFDDEMINRPHDTEFIRKHHAFIKAFSEVKEDINLENYFDARVLASEGVALHYLLVAGGLERVYKNYLWRTTKGDENKYIDLKRNSSKDREISEDDIEKWKQEAKVKAIADYLRRINLKNQEYNPSRPNKITVGMEWEYHDPANAYAAWSFESNMESPDVDIHEAYQERYLVDEQPTTPGLIAELNGMEDTYDEQEHGLGLREAVTLPTNKYKTPIREFITSQYQGGLLGRITTHETFVGVELNKQNTQVMDVRAVLTAAGYVGAPIVTEEDIKWAKEVMDGAEGVDYRYDMDPKPSETRENEMIYFPNFRTRPSKKLLDTGNGQHLVGVEWRGYPSMINYGPSKDPEIEKTRWADFTNYVRRIQHEWLASNAIASVQKRDGIEEQDRQNIEIWNDYITRWDELLTKYGISNVPNEQRFEDFRTDSEMLKRVINNPYNVFLNKIEALSILDGSFRKEARALIRDFNKSEKRICN